MPRHGKELAVAEDDIQPTGKAVVDFLSAVANRGDMKTATAAGMRAAVKEVLESVEGEGWESLDVSKVDLDRYASRFATKRGTDYKGASLRTYQSRFKNAVIMFLEWRKDPAAWSYTAERPYAERKAKRAQQKQAASTNGAGTNGAGARTGAGTPPEIPEPEDVQMIDYPYPLRRGLVVKLRLPADLSRQEASRLTAYVNSLAFEEQPALTAGPPTA